MESIVHLDSDCLVPPATNSMLRDQPCMKNVNLAMLMVLPAEQPTDPPGEEVQTCCGARSHQPNLLR